MGYPKTADLHAARSADSIAALGALGTFLVRGVDTTDTTESATKGTDYGSDLAAVVAELVSTLQPIDADLTSIAALTTTAYGRALLEVANLAALQGILGTTGTPSATTYLRGDGSWTTPSGSGASVSSGAGAPGSAPSAVGDIYIDTTADVAYMATGTAAATDWQQGVAVATSTAGTWESRPQAQIVIWAAGTDTAATTPGAAVGDDIIILADTSLQPGDTIPGTAPATLTGTTDTLAAGDNGVTNLYTNAAAVTVTLANLAVGHETVLVSLGAGGLSVAAGGMSFANSFTPNLTIAQGEALLVKQTAASTWIVLGGTAA